MQPADAFRRLERGIRWRIGVRTRLDRVWRSVPPVVQIVVAATAAYAVAHYVLGHAIPLLAVTVTINVLGFARDARPLRVFESVVGVVIGIVSSELVVLLLGVGWWQIAVVLGITLLVARFVSTKPAFAVAAGVQSMIVMLLPDPVGGPFIRSVDGLVGGAMALLVTALIPRDPRRAAKRDGRALYSVLGESTGSVVEALAHADSASADLALARLRRTQQLIDDWAVSLESAVSVARIAPLLRRHLPELLAHQRLQHAGDMSARHLRLLARRVDFLVRDGRPRPGLAAIVGGLWTAIRMLGAEIDDRDAAGTARALLTDLLPRMAPGVDGIERGTGDDAVVVMLRPLAVDLMVGAGATEDEARALLPQL
jgi:uncharacterized membrane protein YgaE (UPF0421/DUF939 family)